MTDRTAVLALGDRIASLSRSEAAGLVGYLEERYGIKAVVPAATVIDDGGYFESLRGDREFCGEPALTVVLEGLASPAYKISVIKALRELTGCGLAEGRAFLESPPKYVLQDVARAVAESALKKLTDAGAKASLK
jgi:large subunit ribosomal protein L7/L12